MKIRHAIKDWLSEHQPDSLEAVISRSRVVVAFAFLAQAALLGLALIAIIVLAVMFKGSEARITKALAENHVLQDAICGQQYQTAITPLPPNVHKLGVVVIESARKSFIVAHCSGHLPPPPARLIRLGKEFDVPIGY